MDRLPQPWLNRIPDWVDSFFQKLFHAGEQGNLADVQVKFPDNSLLLIDQMVMRTCSLSDGQGFGELPD